jgi:hypothetical protein
VRLDWETATEIENVGFRIYRADDQNTTPIPINPTLIPPKTPGGIFGNTYAYTDTTVVNGVHYVYWLEDVAANGTATLHGPVTADSAAPRDVFVPFVLVSH